MDERINRIWLICSDFFFFEAPAQGFPTINRQENPKGRPDFVGHDLQASVDLRKFFSKFSTFAAMYILLVTIIIALFGGLLFLNIYFRVKVFQSYKVLVQNKIEFGAAHIFNPRKMEEEILPRYPKHQTEIVTFANHIRYSIRLATYLILLITLFGAVLMYFR